MAHEYREMMDSGRTAINQQIQQLGPEGDLDEATAYVHRGFVAIEIGECRGLFPPRKARELTSGLGAIASQQNWWLRDDTQAFFGYIEDLADVTAGDKFPEDVKEKWADSPFSPDDEDDGE